MNNKDFAKRVVMVILAIGIVMLFVVLFVDFVVGGFDDSGYVPEGGWKV
jgi:hypothetical protein